MKKTALVYGNFNILHPGHLRLLKFAKESSDYLIVAVNSDKFNKIKSYLKEIIQLKTIEEIVDKIELNNTKPINATQFLRKFIAMKNSGNYLYIYSDEVINTIYNFFSENMSMFF